MVSYLTVKWGGHTTNNRFYVQGLGRYFSSAAKVFSIAQSSPIFFNTFFKSYPFGKIYLSSSLKKKNSKPKKPQKAMLPSILSFSNPLILTLITTWYLVHIFMYIWHTQHTYLLKALKFGFSPDLTFFKPSQSQKTYSSNVWSESFLSYPLPAKLRNKCKEKHASFGEWRNKGVKRALNTLYSSPHLLWMKTEEFLKVA